MTAPDMVFARRHALVFGSAKGIGAAVVQEWARRGARVCVADIDADSAGETAARIVAQGGEALGLAADVTCAQSVAKAVARAQASFGQVDILMNNVGAALNGHPEDIPLAEWQRVADLNYFGALRAIEVVLPGMLARGSGHIVNTASFAGLYPYAASRIPYAASKAAVIAMSQSMAIYTEPQGIRVSCFIAGPVMTGIMEAMTSWTPDCPVRGPGAELDLLTPEEAAHILAEGMEQGKIMIPTDEKVWPILESWGQSPDAFIRAKIAEFARGEQGIPKVAAARRAGSGGEPPA